MTAPDRKEPKVLTASQIENQREELCDEMPDFWKPRIDALCDTAAQAPALAAEVEALRAALVRIAAWDFNINGDCVAEAQACARAALARAEGDGNG